MVDEHGNRVAPPSSASRAAREAVTLAITAWLIVVRLRDLSGLSESTDSGMQFGGRLVGDIL